MARAPLRHASGKRRRHIVRQTKYLLRSKGLKHVGANSGNSTSIRNGVRLLWFDFDKRLNGCHLVLWFICLMNQMECSDSNVLLSLLLAQSLVATHMHGMQTMLQSVTVSLQTSPRQ